MAPANQGLHTQPRIHVQQHFTPPKQPVLILPTSHSSVVIHQEGPEGGPYVGRLHQSVHGYPRFPFSQDQQRSQISHISSNLTNESFHFAFHNQMMSNSFYF